MATFPAPHSARRRALAVAGLGTSAKLAAATAAATAPAGATLWRPCGSNVLRLMLSRGLTKFKRVTALAAAAL